MRRHLTFAPLCSRFCSCRPTRVTIRPVAAKIPVVMKPGAYEVYEFKLAGDSLSLTQRRNVRGPVQNGGTTRLDARGMTAAG